MTTGDKMYQEGYDSGFPSSLSHIRPSFEHSDSEDDDQVDMDEEEEGSDRTPPAKRRKT